ncbi:HD-GYP domain-containing protein [Peribacillus sp. NPDC097295]|uniref:HD-GYP domain-containing protein n=1 Tax=Peribacillus sp. NPDC097295 TaxID=3364402 RepID=UPI0037FEC545
MEQLQQGVYIPEVKKVEVQRDLLRVLAFSCEIRDPDIEDHLLRVQQLTERLVQAHNTKNQLGIKPKFIYDIIHSSILHDIGKASVPEGILYKPGALTTYERKIIEMHPMMGVDILNRISGGFNYEFIESLAVAENIIRYHHEKWDGTGYPDSLQGDEIPFEARVVAIVDVFDALTSRRPYKEQWKIQDALTFILEQKGKHFDPLLVETFIQLFNGEPQQ